MFAAAQQAHKSGFLTQAESLYRDILKEMPSAYDVHHHLALLLAGQGRPSEAAKHFRAIVKANPTHAPSHANLANALAEAGDDKESITEFKRAIALAPQLAFAHLGLAAQLRKTGQLDDAIIHYKRALEMDRKSHTAFNGLGLAYRDKEDLPRALECFEHAVGLAPENADYRLNFGVTLRKHKLTDWAAEEFYKAVSLRPQSLEAIVFLAETLQEQRRFDEAKECYDRAMSLKSNEPELHERLGFVYLDMGDTEQAIQQFKESLREEPDRQQGLLGLGRAYMESGNSKQAAETLENLVKLYPDSSAGYFYLAASRKFRPDDAIIPQIRQLEEKTDKEQNTTALSFALGKIHDDIKLWDAAFEYYARGNRLRNAEYDYNREEEEDYYAKLIETFSREFFEKHLDLGQDSALPIIIVGMPRSGTTLTEQIISSHPQVIGAGEVIFWGRAPVALPYTLNTDTPYPECAANLDRKHSKEISHKYIDILHKIAGPNTSPTAITDKMPHNFEHLGLIATLFPKARIVHCKRDPMDNCLSIFFQNFGGDHPYAYDLANLGHHYSQYQKLMEHWHTVLPGRILDINYEDTIADPEHRSRKLIEHVGLEWDDACLAPHKLERTVKTASHWQVRQPIYKTSVQRWKNYEKHLGPLKEALGYSEPASGL